MSFLAFWENARCLLPMCWKGELPSWVLRSSDPELNLHPNVLNVAREVAENTSIITREVVNKLFSTYSARTMRIISRVDWDTEMVLVVCTMMAWKDRALGICNWPPIVIVDNYHCAWPEMNIYRKWKHNAMLFKLLC